MGIINFAVFQYTGDSTSQDVDVVAQDTDMAEQPVANDNRSVAIDTAAGTGRQGDGRAHKPAPSASTTGSGGLLSTAAADVQLNIPSRVHCSTTTPLSRDCTAGTQTSSCLVGGGGDMQLDSVRVCVCV